MQFDLDRGGGGCEDKVGEKSVDLEEGTKGEGGFSQFG